MNTTDTGNIKGSSDIPTVDTIPHLPNPATTTTSIPFHPYNTMLLNQNNTDPVLTQERLAALERRLALYETMFQNLNNRMDHQFKKYNTIIHSQQQQIVELHSALSILLNDQLKSAQSLKEKLSHNNSINNTVSSNASFQLNNSMAPFHPQQQTTSMPDMMNGAHLLFNQRDPEELLQEILSNETSTASTPITATRTTLPNQNVPMDRHTTFIKETYNPLNNSTEKNPVGLDYSKEIAESSNSDITRAGSNPLSNKPFLGTTGIQVNGTSIPVKKSSESKGRKGKRKSHENLKETLPIHQFKFIRSPHSVREIWQEYAEGVKGQPSVKEMDSLYHSAWRKDPAVSKRYSRRRVLCKAIENGLVKGYDLESVIELLENHRVMDQEKRTKQPLGWLCQSSNIPQTLK